jgi:hypothetical protein
VVSWLKDGQPLDPKRANIRTSDRDSILFIRQTERGDSGSYEMCVKVDDFEDKAAIIIQIIGQSNSIRLSNLLFISKTDDDTALACQKIQLESEVYIHLGWSH